MRKYAIYRSCRLLPLVVLFVVTAALQPLAPESGPQPAPTAELRALVEEAERLGRRLYLRDQQGARATDVLLAEIGSAVDDLAGYLILRDRVIFVGGPAGDRRIVYEVLFPEGEEEKLLTHEPPIPLPPVHEKALKARELAAEALPMRCAERYNADVLLEDESASETTE